MYDDMQYGKEVTEYMAGITTKENVAVQGSAQTHQSGPGVNKQMTANNQNLELMAEQSQNYKRLDEEQYVIRGSILSCNKGKRLIMIDLLKDHGVYTENEQPVLTCKDCKVGENITNFGTCYCQSEETLCSPVISGWWKQAEGRVMIWEESGGIYEAALRDSATLTCQSGGIIEVLEVPDQTALSNQGTGWVKQLDGGWKYLDESSMEYLFSTWKLDQEQWYYFDDNEYMALGWRYYKEAWYYLQEFQSAGYMVVSSWQEHKEKWYYLGFDGKMVTSTWISSKTERGKEYWVDENGVWVDTRENCDIVHALACTTGGANQGALSQSQQEANAQYIYSYLSEENWSMQAICGLLGNIQQESVMNPGVWQGRHRKDLGYGLVQWTEAGKKFLAHENLTSFDNVQQTA